MKTAILTGGTSTEREVSIKSANFFKKFWPKNSEIFYLPENLEKFLQMRNEFELVIPVFHGKYGEDGMIFAFLETLWLKTTFSNFSVHSLCLDKFKTNIFVESLEILSPKQILLGKNEKIDEKNISEKIWFPCILKPNNGGSSFYTYKIENFSELVEKLDFVFSKTDEKMLICEYILGDEYSVSLVNWQVLPIMKIEKIDKNRIFDYEAKYENASFMKETWPEIEENLQKNFEKICKKIWNFFDIKWFCRIDFIVRGEEIFFLEINTIPWMTEKSILPQSWEKTGKNFEDLVLEILK